MHTESEMYAHLYVHSLPDELDSDINPQRIKLNIIVSCYLTVKHYLTTSVEPPLFPQLAERNTLWYVA